MANTYQDSLNLPPDNFPMRTRLKRLAPRAKIKANIQATGTPLSIISNLLFTPSPGRSTSRIHQSLIDFIRATQACVGHSSFYKEIPPPPTEIETADALAKLLTAGHLYNASKPVPWSITQQKIVPLERIEYQNTYSPTLFSKMLTETDLASLHPKLSKKPCFFITWSKSPWMIPACTALACNLQFTYVAIEVMGEVWILAEGLLEELRKTLNFQEDRLISRIPGGKLIGIEVQHPFLSRILPILSAKHIQLRGTGIALLVPDHQPKDYEIGKNAGIPLCLSLDAKGQFTKNCGIPEWVDNEALGNNHATIELIRKKSRLVATKEIKTRRPIDKADSTPILLLPISQYYFSLSRQDLKGKVLDIIRRLNWVPSWRGQQASMQINAHTDYAIGYSGKSGTPLFAFRCQNCDFIIWNAETIQATAKALSQNKDKTFFEINTKELLGPNKHCPRCQAQSIIQEPAVLKEKLAPLFQNHSTNKAKATSGCLLLENRSHQGSDLTNAILFAKAMQDHHDLQTVLSHGGIVNAALPPDNNELLRAWISSQKLDREFRYHSKVEKTLLNNYHNFRNRIRFILNNLYDFDASKHRLKFSDRFELDRWIIIDSRQSHQEIKKYYTKYQFHLAYQKLHRSLSIISKKYFSTIKRCLYLSPASSQERRSVQSSLFDLLKTLLDLGSPIYPETCEEVRQYIFKTMRPQDHKIFNSSELFEQNLSEPELVENLHQLFRIRREVFKALAKAKKNKLVDNPQEAQIHITAPDKLGKLLQTKILSLPDYFSISQVVYRNEITDPLYQSQTIPGLQIAVQHAEGKACERCYRYSITVGRNERHATLCETCRKSFDAGY